MRAQIPKVDAREATAAVADIGTLFPILAALVVVNGLDAGTALFFAGALSIAAGLVYRVPVAVQPIKAAAAIAIATKAAPAVLTAAGLVLGGILVVLALTGWIRPVARLFPKAIIRGNQLGLGILLVVASYRLAGGRADGEGLLIALVLATSIVAAGARRGLVAVAAIGGGLAWSAFNGSSIHLGIAVALPVAAVPEWSDIATAFTLLVIPQLPLTVGNAVIGASDLMHDYYGNRARRATPRALSFSSGAANVAAGLFGGMPLCHGSSGVTAYHRFGARTGGVNLVVGAGLLAAGLFAAPAALSVFRAIPPPVLAALLAYTGLRHGLLVQDLRGARLAVALSMGVAGGVSGNLMIGMAVGIPLYLVLVGARALLPRWRTA